MAAMRSDIRDLPRTLMAVLFLLGLIFGSLYVMRPFLTAIICATTIAISTWPMLLSLERRMNGNRGLAITVLMAGMAIAFLAPLYFGVAAAVQSAHAFATWLHDLPNQTLPALPGWLAGIPVLGARLQTAWAELSANGGEGIRARLSDNAGEILRWLLQRLGGLTATLAQVLVTLGITGFLYAQGENFGRLLLRFARRLGGAHGEDVARLAALATRGVALGVVLTPLIQSILAGIGLATAGVPHAGLFAIAVLVSCLAQAGPIPALLIPVVWLFAKGHTVPGIGLAAWALVVHVTGPVVRPLLIKRGVDLPLTLILTGVIGGVVAFGVVGLFIGPVLLAVATTLLERWMAEGEAEEAGRPLARPDA